MGARGLRIARLLPCGQQVADHAHVQREEFGVHLAQDLPGIGPELQVADWLVDAADAGAAGDGRCRVEEPHVVHGLGRAGVVFDDVADQVVVVVELSDSVVLGRQQIQGVVPRRPHEGIVRAQHPLGTGSARVFPVFAMQEIPVLRGKWLASGGHHAVVDFFALDATQRLLAALLHDVCQLMCEQPAAIFRMRRIPSCTEDDVGRQCVGKRV